jgi:DNA-directed RNA polymerase specialized sigma24 family protein
MHFPTTRWGLLTESSETGSQRALEDLSLRYWKPLHQFVRSRGYTETEAEDLTQEFFLHLHQHSTLGRADRLRGRFRSFLLGALVRFLGDQHDWRNAQKRGQGAAHLSLEGEDTPVPAIPAADVRLFDREWALSILETALRKAEAEYTVTHGIHPFEVLRLFLPGALETPSYESAAKQIGLSGSALKSEVHRLRLRFRVLVRQEIGHTVKGPQEIEGEMAYLQEVLSEPQREPDLGMELSVPDS